MKKTVILFLALMFCTVSYSEEKSLPPSVDGLEKLVAKYVDLRSETASEKRAWAAKKEQWEMEIKLLEAEKAMLTTELDTSDKLSSTKEKEQIRLSASKDQLKRTLADLLPLLDRSEEQVSSMRKLIPEPLMPALEKPFSEISANSKMPGKVSVTRRIQVLVAFYTQLESIQNSIHVTRELLESGTSPKREMDVMYIGLARAFAVSSDDKFCSLGVPGKDGWEWSDQPQLGSEVRKAISIFNRQVPAELVILPLRISELKQENNE